MFTKQKRCRYCRDLFRPDPRVRNQQIACGQASCRRARKREAQQKWVEKNPDYFSGRYPNTQEWLKEHPGYLRVYKETHPEYVRRNRIKQKQRRQKQKDLSACESAQAETNQVRGVVSSRPGTDNAGVDIQDAVISQPLVTPEDRHRLVGVDIQDMISAQLVVPVYVRHTLPFVDIQDDIDSRLGRGYTWARMIKESRLKRCVLQSIRSGGR